MDRLAIPMPTPHISDILALLAAEYGNPEQRIETDPVGTLVRTMLSQHTSDKNSDRAFASLRRAYPRWEDVVAASPGSIAAVIRSGGLAEMKAVRIKDALAQIRRERGAIDLGFLGRLSVSKGCEWLERLPGVGAKTASCVLLFSMAKPALPVDTHVLRVSRRLGLVAPGAGVSHAQTTLEAAVARKDVFRFHILLIEHGRRTCVARRPRCPVCVLCHICSSCPGFTSSKPCN